MPDTPPFLSESRRVACAGSGGGGLLVASMKSHTTISYQDIISPENVYAAWREFFRGKKDKPDVAEFALLLSQHIYELHFVLKHAEYQHGGYSAFPVNDPKPRSIHKATVRDRLLHRALYRKLYPFFDRTFIYDSYSCRIGKGTHRAMNRFRAFAYKASRNHTRTLFVLKCDIRKFFANIDHGILFEILSGYIPDGDILDLLKNTVGSFKTPRQSWIPASAGMTERKGLPLGNLTSQLFVNIYMNEFDQFVKHALKVKYYIRYADDFVLLSHDKAELEELLPQIRKFLNERLKLSLHPDKVFIKTLASGVDFLGWVHFPDHRVLRVSTKRRMFRRLRGEPSEESIASYLGLLSHGNAFTLQKRIETGYSSVNART